MLTGNGKKSGDFKGSDSRKPGGGRGRPSQPQPDAFVEKETAIGRKTMRDNSGKGEATNNRGNPTLEEHERKHGRSGEAIAGEKKAKDRTAKLQHAESKGGSP